MKRHWVEGKNKRVLTNQRLEELVMPHLLKKVGKDMPRRRANEEVYLQFVKFKRERINK
jgi:hypothetical protein